MTTLTESPISQLSDAFRDSFMQPQCYVGADIEEEILAEGLDYEADAYYCRLSADGFLDCTDWHGPFETVEEAAQCLIDNYGDDNEEPTP